MNTLYIGVDYHPYSQVVAYCDQLNGEIIYKMLDHSNKKLVREFYGSFPKGAVVGVEATGSMLWFERMIESMSLKLKVGNPRLIRRMALSRHKNDFRDAETILDLLMNSQFPEVARRSEESQTILQMLNYRHSMVQKRTTFSNQLQAFARRKGLEKYATKRTRAKEVFVTAADKGAERFMVESRFRLFQAISNEIDKVEKKLKSVAKTDKRAKLIMSHPGIGPLNALAIVHTLGDVNRFQRKEQVAAFVGLDPLDRSSGEKKRIGHISKHGSRLVRFLLGQAAHTTSDRRLRDFYQKVSRRRGTSIAKVATARKLLINCFIMLRDEIDYMEFTRRGDVGLSEKPIKEC